MKKFLSFCLLLAISVAVFAQEEEREFRTIFDGKELRVSGFGGPFMQFTTVTGEFAHMMGGGGGLMINNFFFGGYGLGMTNHVFDYTEEYGPDLEFLIGHGGFYLGYTLFGKSPIHLTISSLVGFGEIGLKDIDEYYASVTDQIFVLSPTIELEANLAQFFRIGLGASYNLYNGVDLNGYSNNHFSSPAAFLSFKFGWF